MTTTTTDPRRRTTTLADLGPLLTMNAHGSAPHMRLRLGQADTGTDLRIGDTMPLRGAVAGPSGEGIVIALLGAGRYAYASRELVEHLNAIKAARPKVAERFARATDAELAGGIRALMAGNADLEPYRAELLNEAMGRKESGRWSVTSPSAPSTTVSPLPRETAAAAAAREAAALEHLHRVVGNTPRPESTLTPAELARCESQGIDPKYYALAKQRVTRTAGGLSARELRMCADLGVDTTEYAATKAATLRNRAPRGR